MFDSTRFRARSRFGVAALFLAASALFSGRTSHAANRTPEIIDPWKKTVAEIEKDLRSRKFSDADRKSSEAALDLLTKGVQGSSGAQHLAQLCAYRAIAESEMGDAAAGLWHWRMAQTLDHGIEEMDLHAFGPSAERLKSTPFRGKFQSETLYRSVPSGSSSSEPKSKEHPGPVFPNGMAITNLETRYRIEFVVDTDGTVKEPQLVSADSEPGLVYANMEALRTWTFQPAMVEGHPVAFVWVQEIGLKTKPR